MSLALISSSASTAACFTASTCIAFLVKTIGFNVIENCVRNQIARTSTTRQQPSDLGRGDVQRSDFPGIYGAGAVPAQEAGRGSQPLQVNLAQRPRKGRLQLLQRKPRPMRDRDMGQIEQFLPAVPGGQRGKGVRPHQQT